MIAQGTAYPRRPAAVPSHRSSRVLAVSDSSILTRRGMYWAAASREKDRGGSPVH